MSALHTRLMTCLFGAAFLIGGTACGTDGVDEGPVEDAAEEIDHAARETGEAVEEAAEETGEAVEEAGEEMQDED